MAEYFLKNETTSSIDVADLGLVIDSGQSIPIDHNDFDGYLTTDLINSLNTLDQSDPSYPNGLVLSDTDVGDNSGDFPKEIAIERLTLKSKWKQKVATFADLPLAGNEDGDIRLVEEDNYLYRWDGPPASQWIQLTFSLVVTEYDRDPMGINIKELVFVEAEDDVYIDQPNKVAYIGPPDKPKKLNGQPLITGDINFYTGRLSQANLNYKTDEESGAAVDYITRDSNGFYFETPGEEYSDFGDKGSIEIYFNDALTVTVDLEANFEESNREGNQNVSNYNTAGTGDSIINGVAAFVGSYSGMGNVEIVSVGMYNNFKYFQTWKIRVNITDASFLRQGYNSFYVKRTNISGYGGDQQSETLDIFYDTDTGPDPEVNNVLISENTPVYRWLSGVKYYDSGSSWYLDFSVLNAFDNVYHVSDAPIVLRDWPGMSDTPITYDQIYVSGVSNPPTIGDTMAVDNRVITLSQNQASSDPRITIYPRDPYSEYTPAQTDSNNYLSYSYQPASTPLKEYFYDENYRMLDQQYDTIPASISGQWDSTESLTTYDGSNGLQLYMGKLDFPTLNFGNYNPSGNPDYSVLASDTNKIYIRAFKDTSLTRASGILRMTGITKQQLYNRDIRVWIKAPTQTGWLDLTRDYNYATFSGADDDGCWINRDIQTNSDFNFTLDRFRTEDSGWMIMVKILYPNSSSPKISYMEVVNWG